MKGAQKYILLVFLFLSICLACKKEMQMRSGFELTAKTEGNTVVLNWSPVLLSGFKSISIYRSVSPIQDPQFNESIDGTLLIGSITDQRITSFRDSNIIMDQEGSVYYKIVLKLSDRSIPSNEEQVNFDAFSLTLNLNGSNFIMPFPERNLLYIINGPNPGILSIIDYSQKKLIKTAFPPSQWSALYPVMNAGNPELFMLKSSTDISCYDGLTFALKYSISTPQGFRDFKVKSNYMYVLSVYNNVARISTYDLSTQMQVNDKVVYNSNSNTTCNLYIGTQSNTLFLKHYSYMYNSQLGNYAYRHICVEYNLVNHLPADSVIVTHPLMNKDTLNVGLNYSYIQPSPDGNYITCNDAGDVLSLADGSIHNVKSGNILNPRVTYSHTGNFLIAKPKNNGGINLSLMDVYSLPGFNLVKSLNPTFGQNQNTMFRDEFLDNDSLVSCNIKHTFGSNPAISVLTVFFKKLD